MTEITRDRFTQLMKDVVGLFGEDYVYSPPGGWGECLYAVDGEPSCLIGQILYRIDPKFVDPRITEGGAETIWASELLKKLGVRDEVLIHAAHNAQRVQDSQGSWGGALDVYLDILEDHEERDE